MMSRQQFITCTHETCLRKVQCLYILWHIMKATISCFLHKLWHCLQGKSQFVESCYDLRLIHVNHKCYSTLVNKQTASVKYFGSYCTYN